MKKVKKIESLTQEQKAMMSLDAHYSQTFIEFKEETDIIKKFNLFLELYCADSYSYLIDTDDNAGELMRQAIRDAVKQKIKFT